MPSDIAGGHARRTTGEFKQFLGHALGSLMEIETQILIRELFGYLDSAKSKILLGRTTEVGKIVNGLVRSLATGK